MKTLLLTEVDFARLQALLASSKLPSEIAALPSLCYSLAHTIPAFPPFNDIYNALLSARGNTNYPEDYDELSKWSRETPIALRQWRAANPERNPDTEVQQ
jgi:hypothetical protein